MCMFIGTYFGGGCFYQTTKITPIVASVPMMAGHVSFQMAVCKDLETSRTLNRTLDPDDFT